MAIESITSIGAIDSIAKLGNPEPANFLDFLKAEVANAESKIENAEGNLQALASGETENLHEVMLSISKAQTAFELVVEVRNRLLEGYQEIMRTQV